MKSKKYLKRLGLNKPIFYIEGFGGTRRVRQSGKTVMGYRYMEKCIEMVTIEGYLPFRNRIK